jgi:hypothetical protein
MRENQTVFPHRACGFAAGAAPIPGIGFSELDSPGGAWWRMELDKDAAEGTSAAPATLELFT